MPRTRSGSFESSGSSAADQNQELDSLYDYLAKIILLGPSGAGKSCLLHRFVKNEWQVLSSQTIGVEFSSKIVKIGTGPRRKRIKLQLWDTAGTERFRAVSRSYYRGATGAILVYDVASQVSFNALPTFLMDARALASPSLTVLLAGNKADLSADNMSVSMAHSAASLQEDGYSTTGNSAAGSLGDDLFMSSTTGTPGARGANTSTSSLQTASTAATRRHHPPSISTTGSESTVMPRAAAAAGMASSSTSTSLQPLPTNMTATRAASGREVSPYDASYWAAASNIPVAVEVSALTGEGVEELFNRLARIILTKIELGEIDPDDPLSGIQYGDRGLYWDGGSARSGGTALEDMSAAGSRRRRRKGGHRGSGAWATNVREWEDVFRSSSRSKRSGCC